MITKISLFAVVMLSVMVLILGTPLHAFAQSQPTSSAPSPTNTTTSTTASNPQTPLKYEVTIGFKNGANVTVSSYDLPALKQATLQAIGQVPPASADFINSMIDKGAPDMQQIHAQGKDQQGP